jgi:hypothetical protein
MTATGGGDYSATLLLIIRINSDRAFAVEVEQPLHYSTKRAV